MDVWGNEILFKSFHVNGFSSFMKVTFHSVDFYSNSIYFFFLFKNNFFFLLSGGGWVIGA